MFNEITDEFESRMLRRTVREVFLAVADPDVSASQDNYGPGREVRIRGDVAVVVIPESELIVTVLLHRHEVWSDEAARRRSVA